MELDADTSSIKIHSRLIKKIQCEREALRRQYNFYDFDVGKDFLNKMQRNH